MARKFYEQMLADEMELRKATSLPRYASWYAAPNPLYYGLSSVHQDFRNPTRINRQDLYSLEYYRQHFLMPQAVVFPNYESVYLFRRNNKRFSNWKNHLPRDKRSNTEKKFYQQEDIRNCRVERRKTDFLHGFERRYQEGWNRDGAPYLLSRDDRNASCLAYRNSNFDFCSENMMMEQNLYNLKQMLDSRNPSSECLSVHENLSQTGFSRNENSMQTDFQNNSYKTSDLEWQDQADKASKNIDSSQYSESANFHNNESWYCPEEQQQIVDMLKEVNLRHDRQLKSDMLLSRNDQHCSDNSINESQATDSSQKSSSSDEDEDNINILLYPGGIPPIPEAVEEDELKSEYYEKTSSDFIEEFQNIFTGPPEKKIINEMIKETLTRAQIAEDDDPENIGRAITDDDKNAVKTVLDFDNMDDLMEKTSDKCASPKTSSSIPKIMTSHALENKNSVTVANNQFTAFHEKCNHDGKSNNVEMISDSTSLFKNISNSHSCSEIIESGDNSSVVSSRRSTMNSGIKIYAQKVNPKDSGIFSISNSFKTDESANENYYITPSQNDRYKDVDCLNSQKHSKKDVKTTSKDIQFNKIGTPKEVCDKSSLKQTLHEEQSEHQHNSSAHKRNSSLNKMKVLTFNSSKENNSTEHLIEKKYIDETQILQDNIKNNIKTSSKFSSSNKTLKQECGSSLSEPFLTKKMKHMGYKRISVSEIFTVVNTKPETGYQEASNHHRIARLNDFDMNVKSLSPSDHLKLILGIGQNHGGKKSDCLKSVNDSTNSATLNKPEFVDKLKANFVNEHSGSMSKYPQKYDSSEYSCYKPIHDSAENDNKNKENHSETPPKVTNLDISVNRKSSDKNKKCAKNSNDSLDLNSSNNLTSESNLIRSDQDTFTKHKKKQKRRKPNLKKESADKDMSTDFVEKNNNQNHYSQSDTVRISERGSNFNRKVTSGVWIKTQKSFNEPEKNNKYLLNENLGQKSKTEHSKSSYSNYSNWKNSIRDKEVSMDVDDSYQASNPGKICDEISIAVKCNFDSSNSKNICSSYPDRKKSIGENEPFMDHRSSTFSSNINKNTNKILPGMHSKQNCSDVQVTSSKNSYQKKGSKNSETFTDIDDFHMSKSNERDKALHLSSVNAKSDLTKTQTENSKDSDHIMPIQTKGSYAGKTRKKFKKKKNEALLDKCEIRSKTEEHSKETSSSNNMNCYVRETPGTHVEYQRSKAVTTKSSLKESLKNSVSEIRIEYGDSSNSKSDTNNLYPTSEIAAKRKYFGKSHTDDTNASFKNNVLVCDSNTFRHKFNEHTANTEEKNNIFEDETVFHSDDNIPYKGRNLVENISDVKSVKSVEKLSISSENNIRGSNHVSLDEGSREKVSEVYNKGENNSSGGNTSHKKGESVAENYEYLTRINHMTMKPFSSEMGPNNMFQNQVRQYSEREEYSKTKKYYSGKYCSSYKKKTEAAAYSGLQQGKEQKKYKYTNQYSGNDKIRIQLNRCENPRDLNEKVSMSEDPKSKIASNAKNSKKSKQSAKITSLDDPSLVSKVLNNHFEQTKILPLCDIPLKSQKTKNPCILRKTHEIRFADFLKCRLIKDDYQKTKIRKPELNSLPSTSRTYKMENFLTPNMNSMKNLVLTITPEVMDRYMRNKQALNMNPSLDVHVHIFLADFFFRFAFLRLIPELENGIELYLSSVIGENLSHTLSLLLNALSFLSLFHMPWNRDNLKQMLELDHETKENDKFKLWMLYNRETMGRNSSKEVLKYWDILSSFITKKKISDV